MADVQLWDVAQHKQLRTMRGHTQRGMSTFICFLPSFIMKLILSPPVGALAWNSHILSSGCRDGTIFHHDVRVAQHHVATLAGHTQEVCGLKWSPDGQQLASGGSSLLLSFLPFFLAPKPSPLRQRQPLEHMGRWLEHCSLHSRRAPGSGEGGRVVPLAAGSARHWWRHLGSLHPHLERLHRRLPQHR